MNGLDLFSGIGGITIALSPWVRPIAYCENDVYAQSVLLSRMSEGTVPLAPIWDDVRTMRMGVFPNGFPIDIIYGGFPCQDISNAGHRTGLAGQRSGLYWELHRIVKEIKPTFVFLENVPGIRTRGLIEIIRSFADIRYDCRWTRVSAAEVGAPHLRERWFLLAYSAGKQRREGRTQSDARRKTEFGFNGGEMGDASRAGLQGTEHTQKAWQALARLRRTGGRNWPAWLPEPALCRGHDGLQKRVDRLKGLGNAVVPVQVRAAFEKLIGFN